MEDFTVQELFGKRLKTWCWLNGKPLYVCGECGVLVSDYQKHTEWHNKLLP